MPDCYLQPLLMGMLWWGMVSGFIFHVYQMVLRGVHLPFRHR